MADEMELKVRQSITFRSIVTGVIALWIFSQSAAACDLATRVKDATVVDIGSFFADENKTVVTFVGYSGAGYEDKAAMFAEAGRILDGFDASKTIVNIGATPEGIGAVYQLAKRRGFVTTGIVSTQAKAYNAKLSPCVDYVFYVEDASWGGFLEGSDRLSPTSQAIRPMPLRRRKWRPSCSPRCAASTTPTGCGTNPMTD